MTKYKPGKQINFKRQEKQRQAFLYITVLTVLYLFGELALRANGL